MAEVTWTRRTLAVDALIATVYAGSTLAITPGIDEGAGGRAFDAGAVLVIVTAGLALTVRRRWPVAALAAMTVLAAVYVVADYAGGPFFLGLFFAVYTVANSIGGRVGIVATALAVVSLALTAAISHSSQAPGLEHLLFLSWAFVAYLAGKGVRDRRDLLASLRERNRHLEETREEEALRRVAEERVRIARDLHDIVAHNVAGISLQAATGVHVAEARPEQALEALRNIRAASRQTLDELRVTLDLLRGNDDSAPLAPTPGLADLDDLVGSVTRSGVPVTCRIDGDIGGLPHPVDVAAYRIVQESLTNVMRHAGPARAEVHIDRHDGQLLLEVVDDGHGVPAAAGEGVGHGLAGMRERAAAVGGTVRSGPRPGGGYRVEARLPVDA